MENSNEHTVITHILELLRREDEEIDLYDNMSLEFIPSPNAILSENFVYDEYIIDFFQDTSTE